MKEDDEEEEDEEEQHRGDCDETEEEIVDSEDENHGMDEEGDEIKEEDEGTTVSKSTNAAAGAGFEANIVDGNFIIRIPNQQQQQQPSLLQLQHDPEQGESVVDHSNEIIEGIEIGHQEVYYFNTNYFFF